MKTINIVIITLVAVILVILVYYVSTGGGGGRSGYSEPLPPSHVDEGNTHRIHWMSGSPYSETLNNMPGTTYTE